MAHPSKPQGKYSTKIQVDAKAEKRKARKKGRARRKADRLRRKKLV